jgi:hypothetical protein
MNIQAKYDLAKKLGQKDLMHLILWFATDWGVEIIL